MPLELACPQIDRLEFDAFIDAVETASFDVGDDASLAALGPLLKRLSNNRDFLGRYIIEQLQVRCADQMAHNSYGIQVVMLHRGPHFFIRANFWPGREDSLVRTSGAENFFYGVPHDHNFSFVTVGYSGPGYWSDYYEYDRRSVAGYPGEAVSLAFVERSRLSTGRVLLYRAHRDVHCQFPPDALSVSLNIIPTSPDANWSDQFRFDLDRGHIAGILSTMPSAMLMRLALACGGVEGRALVDEFASEHPIDHVRFDAISAAVEMTSDHDAKCALLERGIDDPSAQLSGLCRDRLDRLRR